MTSSFETIFEAPLSHEASASFEHPFSWEHQEASHVGHPEASSNPGYETVYEEESVYEDESLYEDESVYEDESLYEGESAYETSAYETSYEDEVLGETIYEGDPTPEAAYEGLYEDEADPFLGGLLSGLLGETSGYEAAFEDEASFEDEADPFIGGLVRGVRRIVKQVAPIARRLAPIASQALTSMIPGAGVALGQLGPVAGALSKALTQAGLAEAAHLEAQLFGSGEAVGELSSEPAQEAALTEVLAAEASAAASDAETATVLASTLPITITIMGGRRALRPVVPTLTQANGRLVRVLRQQGPEGRVLLRAVPAIQRRTVAILRTAASQGQPVTGPLAVRAMSAATRRVLGDPRTLRRVLARNIALRRRFGNGPVGRLQVFTPRVPATRFVYRPSTTFRPSTSYRPAWTRRIATY